MTAIPSLLVPKPRSSAASLPFPTPEHLSYIFSNDLTCYFLLSISIQILWSSPTFIYKITTFTLLIFYYLIHTFLFIFLFYCLAPLTHQVSSRSHFFCHSNTRL